MDDELRAAMNVLAGRELLRRVTTVLAPIPVVALKGVVIAALCEGTGEPPRRMLDVDVLIPEATRHRAEERLRAIGLREIARHPGATTFRDAELGMDLDLHVRLSDPSLFALDERAILARARPDPERYGFDALVPERHDLYAHLVAHFVRNRSNARDTRRLRDFALVARHLPMDPRALARHLHDAGLARATRFALGLAAEHGDTFAPDVLRALPPDPLGDRLATLAKLWLRNLGGNDARAIPVPHLLNASLTAGLCSLVSHLSKGVGGRLDWRHRERTRDTADRVRT